MKKLVLISSYCDTKQKQKILKNNIKNFQKLGVDTLLFSPKGFLSKDIIDLSNHCILTEENPIPSIDERVQCIYRYPKSKFNLRHTLIYLDYGWASLNQIKKLFDYGASLDYDLYYPILYDLNFTPEIKDIINSNQSNYFFSNTRPGGGFYKCGAIFGVFDKNYCKKIANHISFNEYQKYSSAENFYQSIQEKLSLPIHNYITEDLVFERNSPPYYNISNTEQLKIFIDNSCFTPDPYNLKEGYKEVGIHFYDVKSPTNVKIQTNTEILEYLIEHEQILFINLDTPKIDIIINNTTLNIDNLDLYPVKEIKINDNNKWTYLKQYGISKL